MRQVGVTMLCAVSLVGGLAFAHQPTEKRGERHGSPGENEPRAARVTTSENVKVLLEIFRAVEERDDRRFNELSVPESEIHWPPSVKLQFKGRSWSETWGPLQPTETERRMNPRVVAASGHEVVVLWRQKGLSPAGERFDGEVLGLYQLRAGKLRRAQMFYFDAAAVSDYLARAAGQTLVPKE